MKRINACIWFVSAAALAVSLPGCVFILDGGKDMLGWRQYGTDCHQSNPELARLLVKLEKRTRGAVAGHYVAADAAHRAWMAGGLLLPAAVADKVFHEVVPAVTDDRAWVKMVVDNPRNSNNTGDAVALALLGELREGRPSADRVTTQACYYAEPIKAAKTCFLCHGEPKGEPDPFFPQYTKTGWEEGQIIGAVVARVAPRS